MDRRRGSNGRSPGRAPDLASLRALRKRYHHDCEFTNSYKWEADRQLQACRETRRRHGMPTGLYIDIAVGIDRAARCLEPAGRRL